MINVKSNNLQYPPVLTSTLPLPSNPYAHCHPVVFSSKTPNLLAVGMYDGTVAIYNLLKDQSDLKVRGRVVA